MKIKIYENGDDYLNFFDRKLWDFVYTVLINFKCPIQFKVTGPNVPLKMDQHIQFFVPEGRKDVVDYIIQEWSHELRENLKKDDWFWGTYISIYYYKGIELHMEHEQSMKLAEAALVYFYAKLEGHEVTLKDCIPKTETLQ